MNPNYVIYDAHVCPPFAQDKNLDGLLRYKNAGFDVVSVNVGFGDMTSEKIIPIIERFHKLINEYDHFHIVKKFSDIEFCKTNHKLGIAFDLEGANALDNNIALLDRYKDLGVRQMLLAYNRNNAAAGGCQDIDTGLTSYGKKIIKRMNELGIVVDCSHTGFTTSLDIMETTSKPVVFSHSNPAALFDHPRNISDEQIKRCAELGGVIGITGISIFLGKKPYLESLIEHIDYISQLVGPQFVGLGLDFVLDQEEVNELIKMNPHLFPPQGKYDQVEMIGPEQISAIVENLQNKGYSEESIKGILGGNFLRVIRETWI